MPGFSLYRANLQGLYTRTRACDHSCDPPQHKQNCLHFIQHFHTLINGFTRATGKWSQGHWGVELHTRGRIASSGRFPRERADVSHLFLLFLFFFSLNSASQGHRGLGDGERREGASSSGQLQGQRHQQQRERGHRAPQAVGPPQRVAASRPHPL